MSIAFDGDQQFTDWIALNKDIDEIAGGQTPCRNAPDVWFPRMAGSGYDDMINYELRDANQAKQLCLTTCEVLQQCRTYALKHGEMEGIWGGMSFSDRRRYWREQRLAKKAS